MNAPKILLISRRTLIRNPEKLKEQLAGVNVQMAIAVAPEDAQLAREELTEAVGQFQHVTAIVADFEADLAIDENGKIEVIGFTPLAGPIEEPKLITEA